MLQHCFFDLCISYMDSGTVCLYFAIAFQNRLNNMKKTLALMLMLLGASYFSVFAQSDTEKYRRSSLSMILLESKSHPNQEAVVASWKNYPFPDKYNKHNIANQSFNIEEMELSDQDLLDAGFLKETLKGEVQVSKAELLNKPLRYLNDSKTEAVVLPTEKEAYQLKIDKYIKEQNLARQVVAEWFQRAEDGSFNMSLIQERGFYNATEMEAGIAKGQARGMAALGDAGEELIRNTFVSFTKLEFVENEPVAAKARDAAKKQIRKRLAGKSQFLLDNALKGADKAYDKAKEGYSLWSKTWLYQLSWNDSIAMTFYTDLWSNPQAFETTELFQLEFVGVQYNQSLVTFKLGEARSQEEIIDLALVRNVDNAFAELQRDYDVFKPKVPVMSTRPILAQIGRKEGLEGGERFEVLEMVFDQKTQTTKYERIGTVKVDKDTVWDNRYNAGQKHEAAMDEDGNPILATRFKGSKKIQPGMLLKLIK